MSLATAVLDSLFLAALDVRVDVESCSDVELLSDSDVLLLVESEVLRDSE
ncbi:hypothetical protein [Leuconostoc inhae]|nr:hypothetical protein [Leuconostoc inhae]